MKSDLVNELIRNLSFESGKDFNVDVLGDGFCNYKFNICLENFNVDNNMSALIGRPIGNYSVIHFNNVLNMLIKEKKFLIKVIFNLLNKYFGKTNINDNVLVVGLGNKYIKADSLGNAVLKNIIVTRNFENIFKNSPKISAISADVLCNTGIESSDVINSIIKEINPNKLIVIDSLCADDYSTLCKTIQVNNAGIIPGSGVGNNRKPILNIDKNLKILAIGVPLVVNGAKFINNGKFCADLNLNNLILSLSNIDEILNSVALIISYAINMFLLNLSFDDVKELLNKI